MASETSIIISAVDKTEGALKSVQGNLGALEGQIGRLGGIVTGFAALAGAGMFASMIKSTVEANAKLHDMAQSTGASVEALSAMRGVAKISGTDLDGVAGAMTKLAKNMGALDDDSKDASRALASLGLEAGKIRGMGTDEAMHTIAKAMAGFKDSTDKTAISMALFGKSGAQMIPFLNDLGQVGSLQAKVTAEQAEQADNLQDNFIKLQASGEAWKKELAAGIIPALDDLAQGTLAALNGAGGLREEVKRLNDDGSITEWSRSAIEALLFVASAAEGVGRVVKGIGITLAGATAAAFAKTPEEARSVLKSLGDDLDKLMSGELLGDKIRRKMEEARQQKIQNIADYQANVVSVLDAYAGADAAIKQAAMKSLKDAYFGADKADLHFQGKGKAIDGATSAMARYIETERILKDLDKELEAISHASAMALKREAEEFWALINAQSEAEQYYIKLIDQVELETATMGMSAEQRERYIAGLTLEKQRKEGLIATDEEYLDRLNKINSAMDRRDEARAGVEAARETAEEWKRGWQETDRIARDAFTSWATDGSSAAKKIGDTLKKALLSAIYEATLKPLAFNIYNAITGGGGTAGAAGGLGGIANLASTGSSLFNIGSMISGGYGALPGTTALANVSGMMGGDTLGTFIGLNPQWTAPLATDIAGATSAESVIAGMQVEAGAELATIAAASAETTSVLAGSVAAAAETGTITSTIALEAASVAAETAAAAAAAAATTTTAAAAGTVAAASPLAAIPVVGWIALAVIAAYSIFSKDGGGPKGEGDAFGTINASGGFGATQQATTGDGDWYTAHVADATVSKLMPAIAASSFSLVQSLGGDATGVGINLGYNTDPKGDAPNNISGGVTDAAGNVVYRNTYDTNRDDPTASLALESKRIMLATIEAASGVDQAYVDVVKSMKLTTATTEELDAAIVKLSKISQIKDAFDNLGLGADAVTTGLINAAGGIDALASMSSSYYDNFFSESEKQAKTLASVTEVFAGLGMALPPTREAFRAVVEGLDLTTASGQSTFVSLMNVQGAFVSVTSAADTASAAVANLALSSMSGYEAFVAKYYNSAEQQAMHGAHLAETFGKLNIAMPTTLAGFRGLVEGLDLTTEDGQKTAQALLNASGEFYDYINGIDATGDAAAGAANQIQQAVESINSISVGVGEIFEQGISEANAFQSSLAGLTTGMSFKDSLALQIGEITKQLQYFTIRPGVVGDGYGGATLGGHNYMPGELDSIRDQFARILATMSGDMAEFVTYSAQYSSGVAEQLVALNNWKEQQAGMMAGNATLLAALDESYKRQYDAIVKGGGAAGAASGTSALSSLLHQTLGTMQAAILPELHRNQAKAEIEGALAIAKASGVLPKAEDLRDALSAASKLDQGSFATAADYQREYLRTMGTISELSALTDGQLSVEEQTLAATNNVVAAVNNVAAILQPTRLPPIEIGELVAEIKGLQESQRKSDDAVQQLLARIAVDQRVVRQIAEKSDAIGPAPARAEA